MIELGMQFTGYKNIDDYANATFYTKADEKDLGVYSEKYKNYNSVEDYLNNCKEYQDLKQSSDNVKEYTGWDKNALLYAVQDSIFHPDTEKELKEKPANLYGSNIALYVRDGVGLNGNQETIKFDQLGLEGNGLENLKKLATADGATVKVNEDNKEFVITPLVSVGLQHTESGNISIYQFGTTDGQFETNVYVEGRKLPEEVVPEKNQYFDFRLGDILSNNGNVRVANSGSIYNIKETNAVITGNNLYLQAGEGALGTADKPITLGISGGLIALADTNVYLDVPGDEDLFIGNILAGNKEGSYAADSGNIFVTTKGNIYMSQEFHFGYPYVRSYTNGVISLASTKGSIGTQNRSLFVYNAALTEEEAKDFTGENKDKGIVVLSAAKDIYVEGVSTATPVKRMDGENPVKENGKDVYEQEPGGYFKLQSITIGGEMVSITVNGNLTYVNDLDLHDKDVYLGITGDFYMDGSLKVKSLMVYTGNDFIMTNGSKITASENANVVAGTVPDITYGTKVKLTREGGMVEQEAGQAVNAGIISPNLEIIATGGIVLNGDNRVINLILQNDQNDIAFTNYSAAGEMLNVAVLTSKAEIEKFDWQNSDQYVLGDITVKNKALAGATKSGDMAVFYAVAAQGNILMEVEGGNIYNNYGVASIAGNVTLQAGDIYNHGDIHVQENGNVTLQGSGLINNEGNIFSLGGGEVKLQAHNDLHNDGDIFTFDIEGGTAGVALVSDTGNIVNEDDFKAEEEILTKFAKNPVVGVIAAHGDITLSAMQGEIYNNKALVATGDVSIKSLKSIYIQDAEFKFDEELQKKLGVSWVKGITAGGKVTIESTNVYNSMEISAGGDITITATAEKDVLNNAIPETGVVKIYGKNGKFVSENGGITITADGYTTVDDYKNVLLKNAVTEKFSIRNLGNNDLFARNGNVTLHGTYSVENVGDIEARRKDNMDTLKGNVNLISDQGNIYNYEYGDAAFDIKQGTYTGVSGTGTSTYKNGKGENVVVNNVEHSIKSDGDIKWSAGSIYNVSGQYANDNLTINLDDIGVNVKKIVAGKNVTLVQTNSESQVDFVSTIISDGDITFDVEGYLLLGEDAGVYAGQNLTLDGDAGVRSRLTLVAGKNIVVQSDKGDVVLEKSVISSTGAVNLSAAGEIRLGSEPEEVQNDVPPLKMTKLTATPVSEHAEEAEEIFVLRSDSNVSLKAGTSVVVDGQIITDKEGVVVDAATGNITVSGDIDAKTSALLTAKNNIDVDGNVTAGTDNVKMETENGRIDLDGSVNANKDVLLHADTYLAITNGSINSATGNVVLKAEKNDVTAKGDITSGTDTLITAGHDISATLDVKSQGKVIFFADNNIFGENIIINSNESTFVNAENNVTMSGNITSTNKDVNLSVQNGNLEYSGNITAAKGLAAVGTENGAKLILKDGTITGNNVVLYTENEDTQMGFDKAVVGQELTLAGNHWNEVWGEMFDVVMENGYNIRLYSAGRSNDGAIYNLNFVDNTDHVFISEAVADTVEIKTDGTVTIQDLSVSNIAEITAMGTKTDVYGVLHEYDAEAKVIYYAPGRGAGVSIDLHDMFFDGTPESYQTVMDQYKQDSTTDFVTAGNAIGSGVDGNGRGMTLDIKSPSLQYGDGLLLRNYYGQTTYNQRYSLEQWMQHLLDYKAISIYNEYFNKGIEFFQRYNLLEIPDVTVNQPINLMEGNFEVEGMGTDEEGRKVDEKVKYEF